MSDANSDKKAVVTRIYIQPDGDLIVTDLWDEVRKLLNEYFPQTPGEEP